MITHSHEQIKKQLPALFHLHLHSPTAFKRRPTSYNQRQVMSPQLGLGVGRAGVGVASAGEDGAALDAGVEALFAEGEAFEGREVVFFGCAAGFSVSYQTGDKLGIDEANVLNSCVTQDHCPGCLVIDRCAIAEALVVDAHILQFPLVALCAMNDSRGIIAPVEVFQHAGEDFWLLVGQVDPLTIAIGNARSNRAGLKLVATRAEGGEIRGHAEDVFVASEEASFRANAEGNQRRFWVASHWNDVNIAFFSSLFAGLCLSLSPSPLV